MDPWGLSASDGKRDNNQSSRIIFYYERVGQENFKRAAETARKNHGGILIGVTTADDFRTKWDTIAKELQYNIHIESLEIFSHGGADSLYFLDSEITSSDVRKLSVLNFSEGAFITLHSCNSALGGQHGIAQSFANNQSVKVYAQVGYANFSETLEKYTRTTSNSKSVYLQSYDRTKNTIFNSGLRLKDATFLPGEAPASVQKNILKTEWQRR